jgi:hypothetical protein
VNAARCQAKVLTEGGDLHLVQVYVPKPVLPFLRLIASLDSVTDSFVFNLGMCLRQQFLSQAESLDLAH